MKSLLLSIVVAGGVVAGCADKSSRSVPASATGTVKPYPLDTCAVSDEKLDSMGSPFVFTHEGQEIKLCCKSCKKDFDADPRKYLTKLAR